MKINKRETRKLMKGEIFIQSETERKRMKTSKKKYCKRKKMKKKHMRTKEGETKGDKNVIEKKTYKVKIKRS